MCRRLMCLVSFVLVLGLAGYASAAEADVEILSVGSRTPILDGVEDDVWLPSTEQFITIVHEGTAPTSPADCSGRWRALWNSEYLYVLIDVRDEALVQDSDPSQGWLDDRASVYVDGDNSKDATEDGKNDYQYNFRWNHGIVETPVEWYLSPGSLVGVEYGITTTDSGYLVEIKLPWSTMIGGPAQLGQLIGIAVMIDDDDDGGVRDTQMSWYTQPGSTHNPVAWGTVLLVRGSTEKASGPDPTDWQTDMPQDNTILAWRPGDFANTHDVYFGTSLDEVNAATNLDPMGPDKVYRGRQGVDSYVVPERLDLGQTYYWRIDEVNAPPTSHVVFKGNVWSFTVEPVGYPIDGNNITATASSSFGASTGPENTVNGSGLGAGDLHSIAQADIWLTGMTAQPPIWIQYQFDKVYKLHEMWVWNFNQIFEPAVGFGLKDVTIEYSANGADWTQLAGVPEFARAPGTPGYAHNTTVDFGGAAAKYVKITANDNWGFLTQYGLSEVRFFHIPVRAREPDPDSGAMNVGLDATLGFRAGRQAARHDVYIGTDEQAVIDGTADVTTVTETSYGPLSLDLGRTYYWRVDEVNEAKTPTTWQGDIWDFATQEYFVLEDFESYDDYEPNRIFDTWVDGWGVPTNGATIGYPDPVFVLGEHFLETTIVHSGSQSTPLFYDNTAGVTYSEATRTVDAPRDWTKAGVKTLTLWFYGGPNNAAEQMYVKLDGVSVTYDGDVSDIKEPSWQQWNIDLSSLVGVNLQNVRRITIGIGGGTSAGGSGVVYFDDIRLYPLREPKADLTGN